MKHKKMLSAHVLRRRIGLTHPKLTSFVSTRRYDHKEAYKHTYDVAAAHKNFLATHKVKVHVSPHPLF